MTFSKAITGAAMAALGSLATMLVGSESVGSVTDGQWVTVALATVGAFAAVYGVPNAKEKP